MDLSHLKIIPCPWNICKSTRMIDLRISSSGARQLLRTQAWWYWGGGWKRSRDPKSFTQLSRHDPTHNELLGSKIENSLKEGSNTQFCPSSLWGTSHKTLLCKNMWSSTCCTMDQVFVVTRPATRSDHNKYWRWLIIEQLELQNPPKTIHDEADYNSIKCTSLQGIKSYERKKRN